MYAIHTWCHIYHQYIHQSCCRINLPYIRIRHGHGHHQKNCARHLEVDAILFQNIFQQRPGDVARWPEKGKDFRCTMPWVLGISVIRFGLFPILWSSTDSFNCVFFSNVFIQLHKPAHRLPEMDATENSFPIGKVHGIMARWPWAAMTGITKLL